MTSPETPENAAPPGKLSIRQRRALPIILTSGTTAQGCQKAGIDERTWRRWLQQQPFRDAVEEILDRASSEAAAILQAALPRCVQEMAKLAQHKNPHVRMQALTFMINKGLSCSGLFQIDKRLSKWEQERDGQ